MEIGFDNIREHIVPMEDFIYKWRFTESMFNALPEIHFEQLKPLDETASKFLWDYIYNSNLHNNFPFKTDLFNAVNKIHFTGENHQDIKKWLYLRGLPFQKEVFLSWQQNAAMIIPWKLLIKYFDDIYYGGGDDLTVIDESLNWALLFFHEDEIYFGSNGKYEPEPNESEV